MVQNKRIVMAFLLVFAVLTASTYRYFTTRSPAPVVKPDTKSIVAPLTARAEFAQGTSNIIEFYFSDPVDPHELEHAVTISPSATGVVDVDPEDPTNLFYSADAPFTSGVNYTLTIHKGLRSITGKSLESSYTAGFTPAAQTLVEPGNEPAQPFPTVEFKEGDYTLRLLPAVAGKPVTLTTETDSVSSNLEVKIYKTDKNNLFKYLTYKRDPEFINNRSYRDFDYTEKYVNGFIDRDRRALVRSYSIKTDKQDEILTLPAGIYYAEAVRGAEALASTMIMVNSRGILLKQDDRSIITSLHDIETGSPVGNGTILEFMRFEDAPAVVGRQTVTALDTIPVPHEKRVDAVIADIDGETAFVPLRMRGSLAIVRARNDLSKQAELFAYTDKPLYKPGDTVNYRGIVRADEDALYKNLPENTPIYIWNNDLNYSHTARLVDGGLFFGSFTLPKDMEVNAKYGTSFWLNLSLTPPKKDDEYTADNVVVEVQNFKKPVFELQTTVEKTEYMTDEEMVFHIKGTYFDGKPYANQTITYQVYRMPYYETEKRVYNKNFNIVSAGGMCGGGGFGGYRYDSGDKISVKLDAKGEARVTVNPKEVEATPFDDFNIKQSKTVSIVAEQKDDRGNTITGAAGAIVHASLNKVFFTPSTRYYKSGGVISAPLYVETTAGQPAANTPIKYTFFDYFYLTGRGVNNLFQSTGEVITNADGRATVTFTVPDTYATVAAQLKNYNNQVYGNLTLSTTDERGNQSEVKKPYTLFTKNQPKASRFYYDPDTTYLTVVSDKNSYVIGDTITLSITSPRDLHVLVTRDRGRVYKPQVVKLKAGANTLTFPVEEFMSPSITFNFSFFANGTYHNEGVSLNVPAMHKVLSVEVKPHKSSYKPSEKATITIRVKDARSNRSKAKVSLAVIDKAILTLRNEFLQPIHSSWYYYRDDDTNSSSSLTMIGQYLYGGGGGGGGGAVLGNAADIIAWYPELTTDENGEVHVEVDLKDFTTTWKAVAYASTDATEVGQGEADFIVAD